MLPDYPRAKKRLRDRALWHFNAVIRSLTLDIAREPVLEGDSASYVRHDGTGETLTFRQFETTIAIADAEYPTLNWLGVLKKVEEAAAQMGNEMFRHMLEKMDAITKETGNRADVGGNLTPEKFIGFLKDKIELQFDTNGNPVLPTIVGGDVASKAVAKVLRDISGSKELQTLFDAAIAVQKERWRDRESHRKLVD